MARTPQFRALWNGLIVAYSKDASRRPLWGPTDGSLRPASASQQRKQIARVVGGRQFYQHSHVRTLHN